MEGAGAFEDMGWEASGRAIPHGERRKRGRIAAPRVPAKSRRTHVEAVAAFQAAAHPGGIVGR
jgi:hypothetical protein